MRLTLMRMLFLGLIATGGTGAAAYYGGVIDKPEFGILDKGDWGEITDNQVDIHTTLWIYNPNPLGINITDVRAKYNIRMNGVALADGEKENISVQKGNNTVELTTSLNHQNIPRWWARHLQNDEESVLDASAQVYLGFLPTAPSLNGITYTDTIDTDIIGMLDQSMSKVKGTYTGPGTTIAGIDTRPRVEIQGGSAEWGKITKDTTQLRITVDIHNPNRYPIPVPGLEGNIEMNEITVGQWQGDDVQVINAPADRLIPPGATREVTFNINIDNEYIDDWFVSHIEQGEHTDAATTMRLRFDIGDIQLYLPQNGGLTCRFSFTTAILAEENTENGEFQGCEQGSIPVDRTQDRDSDAGNSDGDTTQDSSSDDETGKDDSLLDPLTGNMLQ